MVVMDERVRRDLDRAARDLDPTAWQVVYSPGHERAGPRAHRPRERERPLADDEDRSLPSGSAEPRDKVARREPLLEQQDGRMGVLRHGRRFRAPWEDTRGAHGDLPRLTLVTSIIAADHSTRDFHCVGSKVIVSSSGLRVMMNLAV